MPSQTHPILGNNIISDMSGVKNLITVLEDDLDCIKAKIAYLYDCQYHKEDELNIFRQITHIVDGQPIHIDSSRVRSIPSDTRNISIRSTYFYLNAHNKTTYGLSIFSKDQKDGFSEKFLGALWPGKDAVIEASIRWVLYGEIPIRNGKT